MKMWIDDERPVPDSSWKSFRNSEDAIKALDVYKAFSIKIEAISFDHDLGGDDTTKPVIYWMIENDFWPTYSLVHTANIVGRDWLEGMIETYGSGVYTISDGGYKPVRSRLR